MQGDPRRQHLSLTKTPGFCIQVVRFCFTIGVVGKCIIFQQHEADSFTLDTVCEIPWVCWWHVEKSALIRKTAFEKGSLWLLAASSSSWPIGYILMLEQWAKIHELLILYQPWHRRARRDIRRYIIIFSFSFSPPQTYTVSE